MKKPEFAITFWGVRGSRPVPGKDTVVFGGNTPCVDVRIGKRLFIFDAGTGICNLGNTLSGSTNVSADIFITHTHWDHIQGFPFFMPAFQAGNRFSIYGQGKTNLNFANLMRGQMMYAHFPVSLDQMGAHIDFLELDGGMSMDVGNKITIRTVVNNHPNGAISYRIEHGGRSCCYVTDYEHYAEPDQDMIEFINGADVVIYDSNFTDAEYNGWNGLPSRQGWGHSTWQEGIKLMKTGEAKKLVLFHHATHRTDDEMALIEAEAQKEYSNCIAAREGMVIRI